MKRGVEPLKKAILIVSQIDMGCARTFAIFALSLAAVQRQLDLLVVLPQIKMLPNSIVVVGPIFPLRLGNSISLWHTGPDLSRG